MPILALMAVAGLVAIPERSGKGDLWLSANDIPRSAFDSGEDGAFLFKAVVNPAGKVELCEVEVSSLKQADREAFCERVKRRFSYRPVAGQQGAPSYYVLEEHYAYILPSDWVRMTPESPPNFLVDVKALPGGKKTADVKVNVAVDAQGALRDCSVPADSGDATLARLGCSQLPKMWAAMAEKNAAGQPVGYVRQFKIQFRAPGPG
jgi:hypothetical protein